MLRFLTKKRSSITDQVAAIFDSHKVHGKKYLELVGGLRSQGIVAFRDKFSPYYLSRFGFAAKTIIDVGANYGTPALYETFADRAILAIEPIAEVLEKCIRSHPSLKLHPHNVAVGDENGTADLNCTTVSGHSSFLSTSGEAKAKVRRVTVRRLDDLIAEHGYEGPYGLKIDTEGFEIPVLLGAKAIMPKVEFVIVEVHIKRHFQRQRKFSEVIAVMAGYGFELFDVLNPNGPAPNHMDCLFLPYSDSRFELRQAG